MFGKTLLTGLMSTIGLMAAYAPTPAVNAKAGFKSIFDGKTLDGWDGDPELWRVQDGIIIGQTTKEKPIKQNTFLIWQQGELDDFELTAEFRLPGPSGNSGIQYRSFKVPEAGKWAIGGYQADLAVQIEFTGMLYGERYRGVLAEPGDKAVIGQDHKRKVIGRVGDPDKLAACIKKGDWNTYYIIAQGYHFIHKINDQVMVDVVDEDKELRRRSGLLALQLHAGDPMEVQFRNIQLKRLPMKDTKKIVFIAGPRSHGYGSHEHNAGCLLLADRLNASGLNAHAVVYRNGWPADPTAFDNADAIVMYCDGGEGHLVNAHLEEMDRLMAKGVGLTCLHYGVEALKGEPGNHFLDWIGGYFETFYSVNPFWVADFKTLPDHPITRGVKPFKIRDEWYYHMRFRKDMEKVTPILTATPPDKTRKGKDGPRSGNKYVRARMGMPEHVAWAYERPDGGRGFGFTGGHNHWTWGHDDYRKIVLNAIAWVAKVEIPPDGVPSKPPTVEELQANQDFPQPKNFDIKVIQEHLRK